MRCLKREEGSTLIEVLIASVILLIVVLAVSGMLLQGYRVMIASGKKSETLHQAQEEMESAIFDPDFDPHGDGYEDVEVTRNEHTIVIFGEPVSGFLVTVKRTYGGPMGSVVTYTYFEPDEKEG